MLSKHHFGRRKRRTRVARQLPASSWPRPVPPRRRLFIACSATCASRMRQPSASFTATPTVAALALRRRQRRPASWLGAACFCGCGLLTAAFLPCWQRSRSSLARLTWQSPSRLAGKLLGALPFWPACVVCNCPPAGGCPTHTIPAIFWTCCAQAALCRHRGPERWGGCPAVPSRAGAVAGAASLSAGCRACCGPPGRLQRLHVADPLLHRISAAIQVSSNVQ